MSEPVVAADPSALVAGWYGKIPALGDFASRRLPQVFVDAWDAWLQRALAASRSTLQERWQEFYLGSPVWRFLLLPGACGDDGWAGIMMPSVDKVGRHFPLMITVALPAHPEIIADVFAQQPWFAAIEQIALSSLSMDFQLDELEARLAATPFPTEPDVEDPRHTAARELAQWWDGPARSPIALALPGLDTASGVVTAGALNLLTASGFGKSVWWVRDELAGDAQLHGFSGLPPEEYFVTMLTGVVTA